MKNKEWTAVPAEKILAVKGELQGTVDEFSYKVGNYINVLRHL